MKIELSDDCDRALYVGALGLEGWNVKLNGDEDVHIDEIDEEGLFVWPYVEEWDNEDYDRVQPSFIEWARINSIYIY